MRYCSHDAAKNLSPGEARALSQAGMRIGVVWETAGTHAGFFSRAQGLADGAAAFLMASQVIGQPIGSAIYFAVDYDPTQADIDGAISNYRSGITSAACMRRSTSAPRASLRTAWASTALACAAAPWWNAASPPSAGCRNRPASPARASMPGSGATI